ncbi:2336_t:CDS:2, partial [Cetraspora pellucida]
ESSGFSIDGHSTPSNSLNTFQMSNMTLYYNGIEVPPPCARIIPLELQMQIGNEIMTQREDSRISLLLYLAILLKLMIKANKSKDIHYYNALTTSKVAAIIIRDKNNNALSNHNIYFEMFIVSKSNNQAVNIEDNNHIDEAYLKTMTQQQYFANILQCSLFQQVVIDAYVTIKQ